MYAQVPPQEYVHRRLLFLNQRRLQHSDADDLIETVQCELNAKIGPKLIPIHGTA